MVARNNHYVSRWHQKGFISDGEINLHYLDLSPDVIKRPDGSDIILPNGEIKTHNNYHTNPISKCFFQEDLYSTFFGPLVIDEIERKLFGKIDDSGKEAVEAFITNDVSRWHQNFTNLFSYIDAQKIRTPKGLDWIKKHYSNLNQNELMFEMQAIRQRHCTIWTEGVREIVSAKNSNIKFILSDHPVTIYNFACPPNHQKCNYPDDPSIALKASQTIFPLDMDHCLVLTNYEYAKNPDINDPTEKRTNARNFANSLVRTDAFIKKRFLNEEDVRKINFIIKSRARRYIAASKKEELFPEIIIDTEWKNLKTVLQPPSNELWRFGGEIYVGYDNGKSSYQDAFGRTTPENYFLNKPERKDKPKPNDPCICGNGKKYKKCCKDRDPSTRPSSKVLSIRERNLAFCQGISNILEMSPGKTWDDVKKNFNDDHVKKIHELYGFLWPKETDIFSLLPKPDNTLRALYTGIVDPRVISRFALSSVIYFDEILIQSPFVNHHNIKPEFNPVQNPNQYKLQTLKNIFLLFCLEPFIRAGYINFIPDPCCFDSHMQQQMFNLVQNRFESYRAENDEKKTFLEGEEKETFLELQKDDFNRTLSMLSVDQQKEMLSRAIPGIQTEEAEQVIKFLNKEKLSSPYTLLQDNVYQNGGQLTTLNMSPNFEMSLLISQVTGSFLLTDSPFRWKEITETQKVINNADNHWSDIESCISEMEYPLNLSPEISFDLRKSGKASKLRSALRGIFFNTQNSKATHAALKEQYINAHSILEKERIFDKDYSFSSKWKCIIPKNGIKHNNVQRMMLSYGIENSPKQVPMAIFMDFNRDEER